MDFRKMIKDPKFSYLTEEEKEYLLMVYLPQRKSVFSKTNFLYLLGAFSSQLKKPLFEIRQQDAAAYTNFLIAKMNDNSWKEQYALTLFNEIRAFYTFCFDRGKIPFNPFGTLIFPVKSANILDVTNLPSLSEVDEMFSSIKDKPDIYLAAGLAFRMGLTLANLVGLKKDQIGFDESTGKVYLELKRWSGSKEVSNYLVVPEDLHPILQESFQRNADSIYVFPSKRDYLHRSSLQHALLKAQAAAENPISFSDLRGLALYFMMICRKSAKEVAAYAGVEGMWLTRYSSIPDELRMDAAEYVNIQITVPKID